MTATDVRPGPDAPCRVLIAPCGCLVGGDITMSGPGFCRTRAEAYDDAARGYREEVRTVAEFRAARLCGDATWHTPGDAPRATTYRLGVEWQDENGYYQAAYALASDWTVSHRGGHQGRGE